ncbi:MAG: hypothetical protein K2N39_04560, partial [Lachnospiraceae bacterium]|nr:hypothetical protein [Lachnospiraceae bacterium]
MAKKRSRRNRNKKKKRIRFHRSFFLPFLLTLTAAVALGVLALAAHQWIMEPVKTKKTDIVQSNREKAPTQADSAVAEGNGTETAGDETEAAGTEKETETETVSKYQ